MAVFPLFLRHFIKFHYESFVKISKINKKVQLNWLLKSLSFRDLKAKYGHYEFSQQLTECCNQLLGVCHTQVTPPVHI